MNKQILESIIKRYYLSGLIETSIWKSFDDKKSLKIGACTSNYALSVVIDVDNVTDLPTTEFAVSDTSKLTKMIGVLEDDIKMTLNSDSNGKITSISMSSTSVNAQYVCADITVLRSNKVVQTWNKPDPEYEVEIVLDEEFINTYIKAKSALPDSELVVFQMNSDNKLEMIFGYLQGGNKSLNTSKIKYSPKTKEGKGNISSPIGYNSEYLKEILNINKNSKDSVLKISSSTLSNMKFNNESITVNYHLRGISVK